VGEAAHPLPPLASIQLPCPGVTNGGRPMPAERESRERSWLLYNNDSRGTSEASPLVIRNERWRAPHEEHPGFGDHISNCTTTRELSRALLLHHRRESGGTILLALFDPVLNTLGLGTNVGWRISTCS
jgi:hypothetical protein